MVKKVLSIQSHVVHGYVGNKAATFPLQYRGWDVDALNTVQFSNHPAYGHFTGFKSKAQELRDIIEKGLLQGLELKYDAVLTGYLPDVDGLKAISETVSRLCESDTSIKWVVDPVLGDNGKLYVPEETVPIYRKILECGSVFLTTPNQFEMETLTGVKITDCASLRSSLIKFHQLYPTVKYVIVTSVVLPNLSDHYITACSDTETETFHYFQVPKIDALFSGSGDLFSALVMDAVLDGTSASLTLKVNKVLSLVDSILQRTYDLTKRCTGNDARPIKINDLKLIESRDILKDEVEPRFTALKL